MAQNISPLTRQTFEDIYETPKAPWDIGRPQSAFVEVTCPPLNGTTSRAIIWWCLSQRRVFNATRKERTGHSQCYEC